MTVLKTSRLATAKVVAVAPVIKAPGGAYGQNLTSQWWAAHDAMYKPPPPVKPAPAAYKVVWGDDLYDIARRFNVPGGWPALYAFNRGVIGRNPNLIFPGQILHFPNYTAPRPPAPPPKPKPPVPRRPVPPPQPAPRPTVFKPVPRTTVTIPFSEYIVIEGDRLETLAFNNYGGAIYWWVIADANPEMLHPEDDLTPGRVIRIPKRVPANDALFTATSRMYGAV